MSVDALAQRTTRAPTLEAIATENRALGALVATMAEAPHAVFQKLVEAACELTQAESAGISVLEHGDVIRWHAVAGKIAHRVDERLVCSRSPCGAALDADGPTLLLDPVRHFDLPALEEPVAELFVVPWRVKGETAGTLWGLVHRDGPVFDAEDARVLTTLASFAAAAWAATRNERAPADDALAEAVSARTELARRLATAQEDERRRFARDLHDSIGQSVAALALGIEAVTSTGPLPPEALAALGEIRRVADALGREVHELAIQLRPSALDDLGLHAALAEHIASWSNRSGVEVDFHSTDVEVGRLPPELETILYRVVQEALTNVVKHAQARHVSVVVERHDGHAIAIVEDDGHGFEASSPPSGRRLGLIGMRERVTLAGGTLDIESELGRGTVVIARIPLPKSN